MPSDGNNYLTPKQSIIRIDDVPPCPPPPQAPSKLGDRVLDLHQDRLTDTLLGFFLAVPCNSNGSAQRSGIVEIPEQKVQFKNNHNMKLLLLPKESSLPSDKSNDHVWLKPRASQLIRPLVLRLPNQPKSLKLHIEEGQLGRLRFSS